MKQAACRTAVITSHQVSKVISEYKQRWIEIITSNRICAAACQVHLNRLTSTEGYHQYWHKIHMSNLQIVGADCVPWEGGRQRRRARTGDGRHVTACALPASSVARGRPSSAAAGRALRCGARELGSSGALQAGPWTGGSCLAFPCSACLARRARCSAAG